MKQLVTETWVNGSFRVALTYPQTSPIFSKKEYQETTTQVGNVKTVQYWIEVANNAIVCNDIVEKFERETTQKKRSKEIHRIRRARKENVKKYAAMVAAGQTLFNCDDDDAEFEMPILNEEVNLKLFKKLQKLA